MMDGSRFIRCGMFAMASQTLQNGTTLHTWSRNSAFPGYSRSQLRGSYINKKKKRSRIDPIIKKYNPKKMESTFKPPKSIVFLFGMLIVICDASQGA
ncbi:unnamed protein product [Acanthoscelides obtectus]|uniref:Uncharacterized protein n=1 Tax=Acanthoscelides obtectus TaxID=200917 RepID=A0A9P0LWD7_ACAOB|nr:unnamed protein product [Acanthoscelides obtectus]CAK1646619.1 hypothetical protein AOBTE_LOCUS14755 [Acanthoscelides obtectus]